MQVTSMVMEHPVLAHSALDPRRALEEGASKVVAQAGASIFAVSKGSAILACKCKMHEFNKSRFIPFTSYSVSYGQSMHVQHYILKPQK